MRSLLSADLQPVIIGVGEITERSVALERASSPLALMHQALRRADADTLGASLLHRLDSLDVVNSMTCAYDDLPGNLAACLGHRPRRLSYGPVGGESPIRYIHEAASRIAEGICTVAAVCGGEAFHTQMMARKAGVNLDWPAHDPSWKVDLAAACQPLAVTLGVAEPSTVYPFYENALQAAWGQTPIEGFRDAADLWTRYSAVAAGNPYSWENAARSTADIATVTADNRLIAYPYPKRMVANPLVNQGAAILLSSLAVARDAGIPDNRLIYLWTGASAVEPRDYLQRADFVHSPAMKAVLDHCRARVPTFDAMELYSCFPCVPKMARRILECPPTRESTVTGGLSFFGAPLNNYMTHATAAMVRWLRGHRGAVGLLYGQGEFVTKHHALVIAGRPEQVFRLPADHSVQSNVESLQRSSPRFTPQAEGEATVESHTVLYGRSGQPTHGVVVLRTADNRRTMARIPPDDTMSLVLLTDSQRSPIGHKGILFKGRDGLPQWQCLKTE